MSPSRWAAIFLFVGAMCACDEPFMPRTNHPTKTPSSGPATPVRCVDNPCAAMVCPVGSGCTWREGDCQPRCERSELEAHPLPP